MPLDEQKISDLKNALFLEFYPTGGLRRPSEERYEKIFQMACDRGMTPGEATVFATDTNRRFDTIAAGSGRGTADLMAPEWHCE